MLLSKEYTLKLMQLPLKSSNLIVQIWGFKWINFISLLISDLPFLSIGKCMGAKNTKINDRKNAQSVNAKNKRQKTKKIFHSACKSWAKIIWIIMIILIRLKNCFCLIFQPLSKGPLFEIIEFRKKHTRDGIKNTAIDRKSNLFPIYCFNQILKSSIVATCNFLIEFRRSKLVHLFQFSKNVNLHLQSVFNLIWTIAKKLEDP
jgi:hypothetical protein